MNDHNNPSYRVGDMHETSIPRISAYDLTLNRVENFHLPLVLGTLEWNRSYFLASNVELIKAQRLM
jgi:hypothetical protein